MWESFAIPCARKEKEWETFPSELPQYSLWDEDFEVNLSGSNKSPRGNDGKFGWMK